MNKNIKIKIKPITSNEEFRTLEKVQCIVGLIENKKLTSQIMNQLKDIPISMSYLKRIRKFENNLEVILSEIEQENIIEKFEEFKNDKEKMKQITIEGIDMTSLKLVEVPKYPPVTKE